MDHFEISDFKKVDLKKTRIKKRATAKNKSTIENEEPNSRLIELTDPEREISFSEVQEASERADNLDLSDYDDIEQIDWGDFDPEAIIKILMIIAEKISGIIGLYPYQKPVIERLFRSIIYNQGETISLIMSRQSGKSHVLACAAVTLCIAMPKLGQTFPNQLGKYADGFLVGIYAPTGDKAKAVWERAYVMANRDTVKKEVYDDPDIGTSIEKHGLKWTNGSRIFKAPANKRANPESKTHHLVIIDESQDMEEGITEASIEPMLAFTNGTMCMIGIAPDRLCYFNQVIERNIMDSMSENKRDRKHYEYNYQEVEKYNPDYKKHVLKMKLTHGVQSPWFRRHYALERIFERGQAISDKDFKDFFMYTKVDYTRYTDKPVVVGIDIAKSVNGSVVTVGLPSEMEIDYDDSTEKVLTVQVCDWFEVEGVNYPQQRKLIKNFLKPYRNIAYMVIDTTGVGAAFYDEAILEWSDIRNISPFLFSPKSKNYLMNLFYEFFYGRRVIVPGTAKARASAKWQRFYLQMVNLQMYEKSGFSFLGKREIETARDDYPDSLMLMLEAAKQYFSNYSHVEALSNANLYRRNKPAVFDGSLASLRQSLKEGTYATQKTARDRRRDKFSRGIKSWL
jgi:hypothetical protein